MCDINFMAICLASCAYIMIPLSQGGNTGPIKVRKGPEKKAYDWGLRPQTPGFPGLGPMLCRAKIQVAQDMMKN